ncbi:MAG: hypothetical protein ACP5ER_03090 [Candidatus Bathyarchaeales archaeon]
MRIYGFFDEQFEPPAPFIKATLELERLGFTFPINFHIDTGAAVTALLDRDVELLGVKVENLKRAERSLGGIGGFAETYVIDDAEIVFKSYEGRLCREKLRLFVVKHDMSKLPKRTVDMLMLLPSLLGRDIIYRFRLVCDRGRNEIYLERGI